MLRLLFIVCVFLTSTTTVFSQSVSENSNNDRQNEIKSADVTLFVFGYSLLRESDKVFMPMIEDPMNSMTNICKKPRRNARQWIYMNAVQQYDHILEEVNKLKKSLTGKGRTEIGSIGTGMIKTLKERRDMMETARVLDLSAEVVEIRLETNDAVMDKALIEAGDTVASSAYDTFRKDNTAKIKSVPEDIRKMMEENCLKDPASEENR